MTRAPWAVLCAVAATVLVAGACERGGHAPREPRATTVASSRCPAGTVARGAAPPADERIWCELPDGREHGPSTARFPDGAKRSSGAYATGEREGEWTSWYADGTVRTRGRYTAGRVVGTWSEYFADGELALEVVHDGDVSHVRSFHPGGKRYKQGDLVGGREHGKWSEWDQTGKLVGEIEYDNGVAKGPTSPPITIGIAECDRYIDAYMRCIDTKVPEAARAQMLEAMRQTVEAWKEVATGPARTGLATACLAAADAAKQATASMGCEW